MEVEAAGAGGGIRMGRERVSSSISSRPPPCSASASLDPSPLYPSGGESRRHKGIDRAVAEHRHEQRIYHHYFYCYARNASISSHCIAVLDSPVSYSSLVLNRLAIWISGSEIANAWNQARRVSRDVTRYSTACRASIVVDFSSNDRGLQPNGSTSSIDSNS